METLEWVFDYPIEQSLDDVIERANNLDSESYAEFIREFRNVILNPDQSWFNKYMQLFSGHYVDPMDQRVKGLNEIMHLTGVISKALFIKIARSYWELLRRHNEPFPLDDLDSQS